MKYKTIGLLIGLVVGFIFTRFVPTFLWIPRITDKFCIINNTTNTVSCGPIVTSISFLVILLVCFFIGYFIDRNKKITF